MGGRYILAVLALLVCTVQDATSQFDYDMEDYGHYNWTFEDDYTRPLRSPERWLSRISQLKDPGLKKTRAWTVQMQDDNMDHPSATSAPQLRKNVLNRRFHAVGLSARTPPGGQDSESCPGGVCPNPDLYNSEVGEDYDPPYDVHYDPRYPYDNCHYMEGLHDFKLNGTETCHLRVQGADGHADLLSGGLDGLYLLAGCFEGKPIYIRSRHQRPPGEDRVLYYNPEFGAWEFSVGREPIADQLVLAGGEGYVSPIDVPHWHLASVFNSLVAAELPYDDEDLFYAAAGISVMCGGEGDESLILLTPPKPRSHPSAMYHKVPKRESEAAGSKAARAGSGPGMSGGRRKVGDSAEGPGSMMSGNGQEDGGPVTLAAADGNPEAGARVEEGVGAGMAGKEEQDEDGVEEEEEEPVRKAGVKDDVRPSRPSRGRGRNTLSGDDGASGPYNLEREVQEVRAYWQRHEEEFAEMHLPYEDMPLDGVYDGYGDGYGGGDGYDEEYEYGMF